MNGIVFERSNGAVCRSNTLHHAFIRPWRNRGFQPDLKFCQSTVGLLMDFHELDLFQFQLKAVYHFFSNIEVLESL